MVGFAHLSSFSSLASLNMGFPGCWVCFPPRKITHLYSPSRVSTPGKDSASLLGQRIARPTAYETETAQANSLESGQGLCDMPLTSSVYLALQKIFRKDLNIFRKAQSMLKRVLDFEPLTSHHLVTMSCWMVC